MNFFFFFFFFFLSLTSSNAETFSVMNYGARPNGRNDSAEAFKAAWRDACHYNGDGAATIVVPEGEFLVKKGLFQGPCHGEMTVIIEGTVIAPSFYGTATKWLTFKHVQSLTIKGGKFDGRGKKLWNCKSRSETCPTGAVSLTIANSQNVRLEGFTLVDSKFFHLVIDRSRNVLVQGARIIAPGDSPNTDGIHIQRSSHITITDSNIKTGDDCISIGKYTFDVTIARILCGPGHGISIGSLGRWKREGPVRRIRVTDVTFFRTQNGVRVKTWATSNPGSVRDVVFERAAMLEVQNPILIDQYYCPHNIGCPSRHSAVEISDVRYRNIWGTSLTPIAINFNCSRRNPCSSILLQDVSLVHYGEPAFPHCRNVRGRSSGFVMPGGCLAHDD